MKEARIFNCHRCDLEVSICNDCDYGNIYCSDDCSSLARLESQRAANRRYQATYQGKLKHAEREKKYRERQKQNNPEEQKVTEHPLTAKPLMSSYPANVSIEAELVKNSAKMGIHHCHFCQCEVSLAVGANYPRSP